MRTNADECGPWTDYADGGLIMRMNADRGLIMRTVDGVAISQPRGRIEGLTISRPGLLEDVSISSSLLYFFLLYIIGEI